jgi:hypothetical protein
VLTQDSQQLGSIKPEAWFTRRAVVNLTTDLPAAVQVFMVVLVLFLWKRDSNAAAAAGALGLCPLGPGPFNPPSV